MKKLQLDCMETIHGGEFDWNQFADGVCDATALASFVGGAALAVRVVVKGATRGIPVVGWVMLGIDAACLLRSATQ